MHNRTILGSANNSSYIGNDKNKHQPKSFVDSANVSQIYSADPKSVIFAGNERFSMPLEVEMSPRGQSRSSNKS